MPILPPAPLSLTARRLSRRGPALFLGLSLAGFAAACSTATASADSAPLRCEISLDALHGGGTRIGGIVTSAVPVQGSYALAITSRSGGGSASIRQSGEFAAPAGVPTPLGETEVWGSPSSHAVDLEIRVGGRRLACADPGL